jgi:phospholipid/cholesterol/gamma-HCH transport system permease protein
MTYNTKLPHLSPAADEHAAQSASLLGSTLAAVWNPINGFFEWFGELGVFVAQVTRSAFRRPFEGRELIRQLDEIGSKSFPLVAMAGAAVGAVLALESRYSLVRFGAKSMLPAAVVFSIIHETGPIVTGLVVSGRVGAGIGAELGSMKVTEQIDAMRAMGVDPSKKLVTPRVIAAVVMLFFLSIISDLVGLTGGFMISYLLLGLDANQYWTTAYQSLRFGDVVMGLTKPAIFGFIIATIGCYYGLSAKGGTQGVGRATTQAVVAASVLILVSDFFLTRLLMGFFQY